MSTNKLFILVFPLTLLFIFYSLVPTQYAQATKQESNSFSSSNYQLIGAIGNHIVNIDPLTGNATEIGTTPDFSDIEALVFYPPAHALYGIVDDGVDPKLIRIDPINGEATLIGPIDLPGQNLLAAESLAFNSDDGLLYGAVGLGCCHSNKLVTINPATGQATEIAPITGTIDGGDADGFVFMNGELFTFDGSSSSTESSLYTIDLQTGVANFIGKVGFSHLHDLAYYPETQTLFGVAALDRVLFTVSSSTGQGTAVGTTHNLDEFDGEPTLSLATIPTPSSVLSLHALAFDNRRGSITDLSPYYAETVDGICEATRNSSKMAAILADLPDNGDTHIIVCKNGERTDIDGLPDPTDIDNNNDGIPDLDTTLNEFDMSDGEQIGIFLKWARASYPAYNSSFSYVGHGLAVAPNAPLTDNADTALDLANPEFLPKWYRLPLPASRAVNPNFTDDISFSILSVHDLATALAIGTDNGANPFNVVDTTKCFSGSVEEAYELAPFADTLAMSPNYTFFGDDMLGLGLAAIDPETDSATMADTLVQAYHDSLPETDHPHLMVAIDASRVPAIKESWDNVSYYIQQQFDQDFDATPCGIAPSLPSE